MKTKLLIAAGLMMGGIFSLSAQQRRPDRQHLEDPNSFSMILLGDPQGYTMYDVYQPLFDLCTAWIADNIDSLNIKAVLCTGDLVEENENFGRYLINQTSREMWEAASNAFKRLDGKVPYIISPGNHEYGYRHAENGMTHFPEYFPFERNTAWRDICIGAFPNRNGIASLENAAFEFNDPNWGKLLVITSEFVPRDEVLEWAKKLAAGDKYKDSRVIFMTHGYMQPGTPPERGNVIEKEGYAITPKNAGKQIWEKLIYPSSNILFLICGHTGNGNGKYEDNVGYRIDKNAAGKDVHQMMFNVQYVGGGSGGHGGNGGDGWLRILEFMPDGKTVKVKTYSPLFGISALTKHLAHRTEPYDQFDMEIPKPGDK